MNEDGEIAPLASEEVGYKKPPRQHRLAKGVSGNPHGRPKKRRQLLRIFEQSSAEALSAQLDRIVAVDDDGVEVLMPLREALARKLVSDALAGDRAAMKMVIDADNKVLEARRRDRSARAEGLDGYRQGWLRHFADCDAHKVARPHPLPHPDDILVDLRTGHTAIIGPMSPEELALLDPQITERDALINLLEGIADDPLSPGGRAAAQDDLDRLNAILPPSLRRNAKEFKGT